jgi:hypothetical protein
MGMKEYKQTSKTNGHTHGWKSSMKYTTSNFGHKHRIDIRKKLALPSVKGGHSHRLLKSMYK